jgi:Spy/CpxP family protein refolding chaperone
MRRFVVGVLMGLLLMGLTSGYSYAAGKGCGDMKGGEVMHGEGMPMMGPMGHHRMGMMRADHRIWRALSDLGLDEKQKEAIKDLRTAVRKDAIRKVADVKIARIEIRELLDKDTVDMGAVEAKLKQMESLKTDLHLSRIKAFQEIKATLTPEQREKFRTNLRKHGGFPGKCGHEGRGMMTEKKEKKEKK